MPIRGVLFDRDGVLVRTDLRRLVADLARLGLAEPELRERWRAFVGAKVIEGERDERDAITRFLDREAARPGVPDASREAIRALDYAAYLERLPDAAPALEEARRRGLKVGVLTNNSAGVGPSRMLALAGLAGLVDVALSAQMLGAKKPEPRAFLAAAAALGVDPRACVLFDDTLASVDGARAAGMRAYHVARDRKDHDLAQRTVKDLGPIARVIDEENARA